MTPLHILLRALLYREDDTWFAHCLEFDLIGDGGTKAEALTQLSEAVRIQLQFSIENNNFNNLFSPADGELFRKFAAAKKSALATGELLFKIDAVKIEGVEIREYEAELAFA